MKTQTMVLAHERIFLSSHEAAELLGVSVLTIRRWATKRLLPVYNFCRHLRFKKADLLSYAEESRRKAIDDDAYGGA